MSGNRYDMGDNDRSPTRTVKIPIDRHTRRLGDWTKRRAMVVKRSFRSAIQVGLSAGLAWWVAVSILPWEDPLYAPIGAVVALGTGEDRLITRPLKLLGGMIIAVAVAGVVVSQVGSGAWQIILITTVTTVIGRFLFDDSLARTYSAFHGAVIGALGANRVIPEQLVEASIGAVVGVVIVHVVFPPQIESSVLSPVESAGQAARRSLRSLASALRTRRRDDLETAMADAREIDAQLVPGDGRWRFVRQITRLSPLRRRKRARAEAVIEADSQLSSVLTGVAELVQVSRGAIYRKSEAMPEMADLIDELDAALDLVLRDPVDEDRSDEVGDHLTWIRERIDATEELSRADAMVYENLRELTERLQDACEDLADEVQPR